VEKVTAPGAKQVFRSVEGERITGDVVGLRTESPPVPGSNPLLAPVMRDGRRTAERPSLAEASARFRADVAALPPEAAAIRAPVPLIPRTSQKLAALTEDVRRDIAASSLA
jgi:nicotinate phosphoribosyltransferase